MKRIIKTIAAYILRIGISVALLAVLFKWSKIDMRGVLMVMKSADKPLLSAAFLIFLAGYAVGFYRWYMLLEAIKIPISFKRTLSSFSGGVFFSLFLPSTIGGDVTRSIDLAAHTKKTREVVATVFLDRLSGYIGLVIIALASCALGWRIVGGYTVVIISLSAITGLLAAILLVLFNARVYAWIQKSGHIPGAAKFTETLKNLHHEIHYFRHHRRVIVNSLFLSVVIQAILPVTMFLISRSLGLNVSIHYFFILFPIIGAVSLLPVSIGGLGIRENMTVFLFARAGIHQSLALGMSLLNFSFIAVCAGIGGLIYVFTVHHRRL